MMRFLATTGVVLFGYGFFLLWMRVEPPTHHESGRPDGGWFWEVEHPKTFNVYESMYGENEFFLYGDAPDGGYWRMNCGNNEKMLVRAYPKAVEIKCAK